MHRLLHVYRHKRQDVIAAKEFRELVRVVPDRQLAQRTLLTVKW